MAFQVTIAGQSYTLPNTGDSGWGDSTSGWMVAVSSKLLQKSGGLFALTNEVDFGSAFGIKSLYLKSRSSNPSATGILRMASGDAIGWRNNANSADLLLSVNSSDQLLYNGNPVLSTVGSLTPSTALIADGSGAIASSTTTSIELGYVSGVTSAIQTQLNTLNSGKQSTSAELSALIGMSTTGLVSRTASASYSPRTITGTTNRIVVTNGDGVSGNPTLDIGTDVVTLTASQTLTNKTLTSPVLATPQVGMAVTSKTSSYSVSNSDYLILCNVSSVGFTVTLPTAVGITGQSFVIKKTDSTFNIVAIATTSSQTIDGSSSTTLNTQNETLTLVSDGSNWQILDRKTATSWISYTPTFSTTTNMAVSNTKWRRIANQMHVTGRVDWSGTVSSGDLTFTIPGAGTLTPDGTTGTYSALRGDAGFFKTGIGGIRMNPVLADTSNIGMTYEWVGGTSVTNPALQSGWSFSSSSLSPNSGSYAEWYVQFTITGWNG